MGEVLRELSLKIVELNKKKALESSIEITTQEPENTTVSTNIPAYNRPFKPLKEQNLMFSTGNKGVPTDRQTNQQTDT